MPKFSIIIPLYNKEKYIENTLKSVLKQTFQDFEIIIINDGSTDLSIELVNQIQDDRIKLVHQENQGVSVARNNGIKLAEAEYICFLDADDFWKLNYLENLFDTIKKFPDAKMYCSRYVTQINSNKFIKNTFLNIKDDYEGYIEDFFYSSLINRVALTSGVCITKDIFYEIGGFDKKISSGQDLDYWIRIALSYKIVITSKITLVYNYLNENVSLSKTNINEKKIPDLDVFNLYEKNNPNLKKFLDLYRIEYAIQYKIAGDKKKSKNLIDKKTLNFKTKILLNLPSIVLKKLLKVKHFLKRKGIDFTIYH